MIPVKIIKSPGAVIPEYKTKNAAGADIYSFLQEDVIIGPGEVKLIPTGISIELPPGYEAQIRPRSGLAVKHGISLLNSPGTIDADYRGEIKIIMINSGTENFTVTNHMRIAQMIFAKVYSGMFIETEILNESNRGEGGFGHTGI
ncbi:MAG: dUTP diphosphatase [Spirochaetes bacterium]|nr:dUTP diphosphatase [Spirochaetota bacterium]